MAPPTIDFSESLKKLFFVENAQHMKQGDQAATAYMNDIPPDLISTIVDTPSFNNLSKMNKVFGIAHVSESLATVSTLYHPSNAVSTDLVDSDIRAVLVSLRKYFVSPARAIKCKEPHDYRIAIRDMHTDLFREAYGRIQAQVSTYSSAQQVFMFNVEGSGFSAYFIPMLNALLEKIEGIPVHDTLDAYINTVLRTINDFDYQKYAMLSVVIRSLIFSVYYPYFVFLYILSFISDKSQQRSFYVHRVAKLACYLYIFHFVRHIYYAYISAPQNATRMNDDNGVMMRRIIDNITLNVFDLENELMIDQANGIPSYYNTVKQMSLNNKSLSTNVADKAATFDVQKYNLTSVLANETVINRDERRARTLYVINFAVAVLIAGVAIGLLATKKYMPFYVVVGVALFGILAFAIYSMLSRT